MEKNEDGESAGDNGINNKGIGIWKELHNFVAEREGF
jgi:hypothetical protein